MKSKQKSRDLEKLKVEPIEKNHLEQLKGGFSVFGVNPATSVLDAPKKNTNTNTNTIYAPCGCGCGCSCSD